MGLSCRDFLHVPGGKTAFTMGRWASSKVHDNRAELVFWYGLQEKYKLKLPPCPGTSQCVKLSGHGGNATGRGSGNNGHASVDAASIRLNYSLAEQSGGLLESDADPDPIKQFDAWFKVSCQHTPTHISTCLPVFESCPCVFHYSGQSKNLFGVLLECRMRLGAGCEKSLPISSAQPCREALIRSLLQQLGDPDNIEPLS